MPRLQALYGHLRVTSEKVAQELDPVILMGLTPCSGSSVPAKGAARGFHTEMAKLNGATEAEIEDAVHYAKWSSGWSAHVNQLQLNYDKFKDEVLPPCEHVRSAQGREPTEKERVQRVA